MTTTDAVTGISIHSSFLPHLDPEASLTFYRDVLGFEVRLDVGYESMRWITVGPAGQPDTAIVLHPVGVGTDLTDSETALLTELVAKGTYFGVNLATDDLDATFAALAAAGADIVQEPVVQDYGLKDAAVRDPAGNLLRIQEKPAQDKPAQEKPAQEKAAQAQSAAEDSDQERK